MDVFLVPMDSLGKGDVAAGRQGVLDQMRSDYVVGDAGGRLPGY